MVCVGEAADLDLITTLDEVTMFEEEVALGRARTEADTTRATAAGNDDGMMAGRVEATLANGIAREVKVRVRESDGEAQVVTLEGTESLKDRETLRAGMKEMQGSRLDLGVDRKIELHARVAVQSTLVALHPRGCYSDILVKI